MIWLLYGVEMQRFISHGIDRVLPKYSGNGTEGQILGVVLAPFHDLIILRQKKSIHKPIQMSQYSVSLQCFS